MRFSTRYQPKSGLNRFHGRFVLYLVIFAVPLSRFAILQQGYQRAGLLTSEELALIKRIDRQSRAKIDSILLTDGLAYATLYLNLLKKLVRLDTTQYILVMIGDTLIGSPSFTCTSGSSFPYPNILL
jgi:hypothetical protein